ncbi:MAG: GntR family transcriptional regulator [Anaerolineales bacterium]|nr:GntR family transcriptional regulator [Anaerolineales bacterium]
MPNTISKKEKAYQAIKQAIIARQLEAAKIYSIAELSEIFEVGRTPAREALVILASEGLIDPIPRSGYMVKPLSIHDVVEIFHLRSVLEVEAVGLAAERITDDDIYLLEENNRQEQEIVLSPHSDSSTQLYRKGYDLNLEFHLTIARASGNNRLADLLEKMLNELERILAHDPYIVEPQQHSEILEGLKRRDKQGSQEAMRKHLEDTKNRSLSRF